MNLFLDSYLSLKNYESYGIHDMPPSIYRKKRAWCVVFGLEDTYRILQARFDLAYRSHLQEREV